MEKEDLMLLMEWFDKNQDHRLNFLEKEAVKAAIRKADTVGDLASMAVKLLKKQRNKAAEKTAERLTDKA